MYVHTNTGRPTAEMQLMKLRPTLLMRFACLHIIPLNCIGLAQHPSFAPLRSLRAQSPSTFNVGPRWYSALVLPINTQHAQSIHANRAGQQNAVLPRPLRPICTIVLLDNLSQVSHRSIRPRRENKRHILAGGTYLLAEHAEPLLQTDALVCAVLDEQGLRPQLERWLAAFPDHVERRDGDATHALCLVVASLLEHGMDALAEVVVEEGQGRLACKLC